MNSIKSFDYSYRSHYRPLFNRPLLHCLDKWHAFKKRKRHYPETKTPCGSGRACRMLVDAKPSQLPIKCFQHTVDGIIWATAVGNI